MIVCYFVLYSAPGGDLQTLIDGDLVPLEGDVVHFVRQLVEGLAYLHERNIAHLDIKVSSTHKRSRTFTCVHLRAGGTFLFCIFQTVNLKTFPQSRRVKTD